MFRSIEKIFHPVWRQTKGKRKSFEGWYYRLVSADHRHSLALIPGVRNGAGGEAFLQVLMQGWEEGLWVSYELDAFASRDKPFSLQVGGNRFSLEEIEVNLSPSHQIAGKVQIKNAKSYPVSLASPGIMGWYRYVPKMECYHGVIITDAELEGGFVIHGQAIDFSEGRLYVEKDWGTSFPSAWVWAQSNQFKQTETSFMLSVADIPWRKASFTGFLIFLQTPDKLYRFTTYTGAKIIKWQADQSGLQLQVEQGKLLLTVKIHHGQGASLRAPRAGEMNRMIKETVSGKIDLWLEKSNGERILSCKGEPAAFEQVGQLKWGKKF
jgi:hypothetical protein